MVRILVPALLALVLAVGAASAQTESATALPEEDCAFLEQSFQQVYDGMRERSGGQEQPDPATVTMFVNIQNNIILMHTARGCETSKLIDLAREEARKYSDRR